MAAIMMDYEQPRFSDFFLASDPREFNIMVLFIDTCYTKQGKSITSREGG